VRTFTPKAKDGEDGEGDGDEDPDQILELEQGAGTVAWDLRYPGPESFPGMVIWNQLETGPTAVPGTYKARLTVGDWSEEAEFRVVADPRSAATAEDFKSQFEFLIAVGDQLNRTHQAIGKIRESRDQIDLLQKRLADSEAHQAVNEAAEELKEKIGTIEKALYQTQNRSRQDPLNFPIRLNDKLAGLYGSASGGDLGPTEGAVRVRDQLFAAIDEQLKALEGIWAADLPSLNAQVKEADVPAIQPKESMGG